MQKIEKLNRNKILDIINRLEFFNKFTLVEKHVILAFNTQFFIYQKEEVLIEEGSYDSSFFILLDGNVLVTKGSSSVKLDVLEPGDFFGEISFLAGGPRTANVIAQDLAIVIKIDHRMMKRLNVEIREKIKDKIIEKLISRLNHMNEEYINYVY